MNQDLPRWPRIAVAAATVVGLGAGVAGIAVVVGVADGDRTQEIDPGSVTLVAYDTCDSALDELKSAALPHVGPYGLTGEYATATDGEGDAQIADGDAAAAPMEDQSGGQARDAAPAGAAPPGAEGKSAAGEAPAHSGTNNQESDVDEPDIVKTDGRRVVSVAGGQLRVVDVASHKQTALVALPGGYATQLLISGDRALVLTASGGVAEPMPRTEKPMPGGGSPGEPVPDDTPPDTDTPPIDEPVPAYGAQLVLVDLTGKGSVLGTLEVEGTYLDARQVGSVARVVVRSTPRLKFTNPDGVRSPSDAMVQNRGVVESSSISDWLPRYHLSAAGRQSSGELLECTAVSHPKRYTGTAMLSVLTFDLTKQLGNGDPIGIAADGNTVYGTGKNLYVADDHFAHGVPGFGPMDGPGDGPMDGGAQTEIYQFDISGTGKPKHVASGGVPGSLLNQYSLSEHDGNLRVATTASGNEESHSMVSVLTRRGKALAQVGRVDGLGKGERIYAVRFLGATAYVVTFRQTDPLYTVDLTNPAKPRVTGELKITGYSSYLHPVGDGRLLGVGQEATTGGMTTGTQVSLFDTSDRRGAERIAQLQYPGGHSEVESDPHAFLYWPEKNLVVIPVAGSMPDSSGQYLESGAMVLKLSGRTLSEVGMLRHEDRTSGMPFMPRRVLVIGNELWTVSDGGILVSNLDTLREVTWLAFT
jgi:hypothetical protein